MTKPKRNPRQRGRKSSAALSIVRSADVPPSPPRNLPAPPRHLSDEAAAWWAVVVRDYALEAHHLKLLQCAAEAWDRMQEARETVARDGLTFEDGNGAIRAHPSVAIERDARTLFARLVRELNLDEEPPDAR